MSWSLQGWGGGDESAARCDDDAARHLAVLMLVSKMQIEDAGGGTVSRLGVRCVDEGEGDDQGRRGHFSPVVELASLLRFVVLL